MKTRKLRLSLSLFSVLFLALSLAWGAYSAQLPLSGSPGLANLPDLYEASIAELQAGLEQGHFTSVDLVTAYLARIEEVNLQGPALRAIIETNSMALAIARALDVERYASGPRGPLHGIPIIVKDNIATVAGEGMNTTAGSFALFNSVVPRDAHVVTKLRAAGAIILGKANLSEWSHARGDLPSGWSARGGQCSSPYVPQGDPSGSSSGSAVSTAIGLAAAALGTETDGSIVFPCSRGNLVGIKPTVGLTSRAGVIPISSHQDTVGPMARSVADAAVLLSALAGQDERDNYTLAQPSVVPDYTLALKRDGLKGVRLGVPRRRLAGLNEAVAVAFNASLDTMRRLGATIVDPAELVNHEEFEMYSKSNETAVMRTDLKVDLKRYIAGLLAVPSGVKDLADLVAYNIAHADEELVEPYWTDQSVLTSALNATVDQDYFDAIVMNRDIGGKRGIDATLRTLNLSALIMPSMVASTPASVAGYPIVAVPLGFLPATAILSPATPVRDVGPNQPFGLSFVGTAFSEFDLISYAYAYEQATHTRLKMRAYPDAIPKTQLVDVVGKRRQAVLE
ncbi:amidase signature enzyme [Dichomitus squalens LYAD-421 SS1]|nr:amidase signature enzyme [Dichomitus squalens LYAD-421 SS1]EJF59884.1 amidase signature enzyme [Dichomitus squalens LYAD-421 SS1]TBU57901.1 amidase signature enzyme [Dichomitus squalens]